MDIISHKIDYRVLYADTDAMGVMYYANYLRLYEAGRGDYMRKIGYPRKKMEDMKIVCPALKVEINYIGAARLDDELIIVTKIAEKPIVKILFDQKIYNKNNELINSAVITIGFLNLKSNKLTRCPKELAQLF